MANATAVCTYSLVAINYCRVVFVSLLEECIIYRRHLLSEKKDCSVSSSWTLHSFTLCFTTHTLSNRFIFCVRHSYKRLHQHAKVSKFTFPWSWQWHHLCFRHPGSKRTFAASPRLNSFPLPTLFRVRRDCRASMAPVIATQNIGRKEVSQALRREYFQQSMMCAIRTISDSSPSPGTPCVSTTRRRKAWS